MLREYIAYFANHAKILVPFKRKEVPYTSFY